MAGLLTGTQSSCSAIGVPSSENPSQSAPSPLELDSAQRSALELEILRTLEDNYQKGVAVDLESGDVVVTVFTNGTEPADTTISEYKRLAATVAPDRVIIVELESGEAPSPD